MTPKTAYYAAMAEEAARQVTGSWERWTSFLTTAGRLYKYPYHEQLMIHAQRPDATACAEYDLWNDKMNRYVKRGSKGIALLDNSGDKPRLRYVFDVSDTGTRRNSRPVYLWKMNDEYVPSVQAALEKAFGVPAQGNTLDSQIDGIARQLATDYWEEHGRQFLDIIAESYLEGYDEFNTGASFKNAATVSIAYTLYSRCVENPDEYFEHEDFLDIFDFNTRQTANALGTAVSQMSAQVFREIEVTIRNYERTKQAERSQNYDERNDIQTGRGLSDSEHRADEQRNETVGQVRQDASGIPSGEQSDALQRSDSQRETVSTSPGDRRDSETQSESVDEPVSDEQSGTGQREKSDGMGAAHEHIESTGRGNRDDGAYQQLTLNLLPSEEEQIHKIDEAESKKTLPAFSLPQSEIDHVLLLGSNTDHARKIVALDYMKGKSAEKLVETLKATYHGGFGLKEENHNISAWYADDGIHLAVGNSSQYVSSAQIIAWEDAVIRIGELLESGQYATNVELAEAPGFERKQVAEALWHLYHDLSDDARESGFFPSLERMPANNFPEQTAMLAEKLADPEFLDRMKTEYHAFMYAYSMDDSVLRFHYHKTNALEKRLNELDMPLREYQSNLTQMPIIRQFITDDELNRAMAGGSGFSGGKLRIYNYFENVRDKKERADFLKNEYGTGGHSHAISGTTGSFEDHSAKGLEYKKAGCDSVFFNWTQVADRIASLIRRERYLTPMEQARKLIDDFCMSEYESHADFSDLRKVGVAYTTITDDEIPIQANVNLVDFTVERYLDDWLLERRHYDSLEDLIDKELESLDFGELTDYEESDLETYLHYQQYRDIPDYELPPNIEQKETEESELSLDDPEYHEEETSLEQIPARNYHIADDALGEGGPKQKFARNIAAIQILQTLESENRSAIPEEQEILSNYVGWGGLADAFDPNKDNWAQEYTTLKGLLTDDEYAAARASTLNAHYTSPTVIRAIYDAIQQMGFEAGNILEPAMGVGNFFGMLPPEMQNSRLYGVELDSITGRIAQKLYPNADIKVAGFETTDRRDFFDLAVGNVPFGNYKVSDKPYDKLGFSIHNYFFGATRS